MSKHKAAAAIEPTAIGDRVVRSGGLRLGTVIRLDPDCIGVRWDDRPGWLHTYSRGEGFVQRVDGGAANG